MKEWEIWLILLTFLLYASATVVTAVRFWTRNQKIAAAGVFSIGLAFAVHTALILLRGFAAGRLPFSNLYEFTIIFAWGTVVAFLYCAVRFRLLAASPLVMAMATLLMGVAAMMPRDIKPLMPALRSGWLQAHVATGILSYGALAVSAILAVIMLVGGKDEEKTQDDHWTSTYWQMPSLEKLEKYVHGLIVFGFIFLSLLIVTGAVWAEETWGRWWGWDPKEAWALVTWLIYLVYLHGRNKFGWRGKATAWFSAVGFLAVMFTLFGVTYLLPGLHSYK